MADTFFEKFTRCAKVDGLFFLIVLFGSWLADQTDSVQGSGISLLQLTCDQLVSTCIGWPNGEKFNVDLRANLSKVSCKSSQVGDKWRNASSKLKASSHIVFGGIRYLMLATQIPSNTWAFDGIWSANSSCRYICILVGFARINTMDALEQVVRQIL